MDYVRLGKTGLKVSRLCMGCMSFGTPGGATHPWVLPEEEAQPFFRKAVESGINFFDTANHYNFGDSEKITGQGAENLRQARRDRGGDQGRPQDERRRPPQHKRDVAQACVRPDRPVALSPWHGLCRHALCPQARSRHRIRRDARSAAGGHPGGQGALCRRLVDVGLAVRQVARNAEGAGLPAIRRHAEFLQSGLSRRKSAR